MTKEPGPTSQQQRGNRWEFLWWGFGKGADREPGFEPSARLLRRWRLGPIEIRVYQEPRSPSNEPMHGEDKEPPQRRLPGP